MFWQRGAPPPPKIIIDAEAKCAADISSGMAVEFVGSGPYPLERDLFFKLYWRNTAFDFRAGYDFDETRIRDENPSLDAGQWAQAIWDAAIANIYLVRPAALSSGDELRRLALLVLKLGPIAFPHKKMIAVSNGSPFSAGSIREVWRADGAEPSRTVSV